MTEINFMSLNNFALSVVSASLFGCSAIAAPMSCPAHFSHALAKYTLDNASLYDGPPAEMADLVPDQSGSMDKWDIADVDPYLVCRYAGTSQVVTFHAVGAKDCEAGGQPFQAFCR